MWLLCPPCPPRLNVFKAAPSLDLIPKLWLPLPSWVAVVLREFTAFGEMSGRLELEGGGERTGDEERVDCDEIGISTRIRGG